MSDAPGATVPPGEAVEAAAAELYGLEPAAFTAARDTLAAAARRSGDRESAAAIKKLHRPTTGAWLANLLVRRRGAQLAELLELGAVMREAQSRLAADELRRLSRRRQQVVSALGRDALGLAREAGPAVSAEAERELQATLEAALADASASEALRAGCLTRGLQYSGLGPVLTPAGIAAVPVTTVPETTVPEIRPPADGAGAGRDELADARRRREEQAEAAGAALLVALTSFAAARREVDGTARQFTAAQELLRERSAALHEAEDRLIHVREQHSAALEQLAGAASAQDAAGLGLREAEDRVVRARETLDRGPG